MTRAVLSVVLVTVPSLHAAGMAAAVSVRRWMRLSSSAGDFLFGPWLELAVAGGSGRIAVVCAAPRPLGHGPRAW